MATFDVFAYEQYGRITECCSDRSERRRRLVRHPPGARSRRSQERNAVLTSRERQPANRRGGRHAVRAAIGRHPDHTPPCPLAGFGAGRGGKVPLFPISFDWAFARQTALTKIHPQRRLAANLNIRKRLPPRTAPTAAPRTRANFSPPFSSPRTRTVEADLNTTPAGLETPGLLVIKVAVKS